MCWFRQAFAVALDCAAWIVHVSDDAQKRLTGAAGTESGESRGQRRPPRDVAHAFVGDVHGAGGDVLDPVEVDPDSLAGPEHRLTEQVVRADVRQRAAIAPDRGPNATKNRSISQLGSPRSGS
jgi:hypothetical protein